jgi:hypothetical protein
MFVEVFHAFRNLKLYVPRQQKHISAADRIELLRKTDDNLVLPPLSLHEIYTANCKMPSGTASLIRNPQLVAATFEYDNRDSTIMTMKTCVPSLP